MLVVKPQKKKAGMRHFPHTDPKVIAGILPGFFRIAQYTALRDKKNRIVQWCLIT